MCTFSQNVNFDKALFLYRELEDKEVNFYTLEKLYSDFWRYAQKRADLYNDIQAIE